MSAIWELVTDSVQYALPALAIFTVLWLCLDPIAWWKLRKVPGPPVWPLIGNLYDISNEGWPGMCQRLQKTYGHCYKIWYGGKPVVIISDADAIRKLCQGMVRMIGRHPHAFRGQEKDAHELGLVSARGQDWRTGRKIFEAALLSTASLRSYIPLMDKNVVSLVNKIKGAADSKTIVDMAGEFGGMTLSVVGSTAYGVDFHTVDSDAKGAALLAALRGIFTSNSITHASKYLLAVALVPAFAPIIRFVSYLLPDEKHRKSINARRMVIDLSMELVKEARAAAAKAEAANPKREVGPTVAAVDFVPPTNAGPSFLRGLVEGWGTEKTDKKISDIQVVAFSSTLILGGYETTAATLSFTVYLLAVNPEKRAKLLQEIDAANLPKPGERELTLEDLDKVPYAEAVIKEAVRLYPALPLTNRVLDRPITVDGVPLEPGTYLQFDLYSIHRNPKYWKEPEAFIPERFLPGNTELAPQPASAFLPFGAGARMCVGYKFAMQLARMAVVRLYQQCSLELEPVKGQHPVQLKTGSITTCPWPGLYMSVQKR